MTAAEEQWAKELHEAEDRGYRRGQEDFRHRARRAIVSEFRGLPSTVVVRAELAVAELEINAMPSSGEP